MKKLNITFSIIMNILLNFTINLRKDINMRNNIIYLFCAIFMIMIAACSSNNEPVEGIDAAKKQLNMVADEQIVIKQQNVFAVNFFNSLYDGNNMIVSPLSAVCNLSLLANASEDKTQKEFLNALGCDDLLVLNSLNCKLMQNIDKLDSKKVKIGLANSIWM